eukprot:jgi/Ulvmu1/11339/UM074_0054.1
MSFAYSKFPDDSAYECLDTGALVACLLESESAGRTPTRRSWRSRCRDVISSRLWTPLTPVGACGQTWLPPVDYLLGLLSGLLLCGVVLFALLTASHAHEGMHLHGRTHKNDVPTLEYGHPPTQERLVLYAFSDADPEYYVNLRFFVKHGIPGCDSCEFIITVNKTPSELAAELPQLPANAKYVFHRKHCFDWGTFGWVLKDIDVSAYSYFYFLNSTVRGPFLPQYLKGRLHFTELMAAKLVGNVKLVGSIISCATVAKPGASGAVSVRRNPHVQSHAVATDAVGLQLMMNDGRVFGCYSNIMDALYYSELGASAVILDANYTLDSFMVRYQGVDWRNKNSWDCNAEADPYQYALEDGVNLAPMELMFVTVRDRLLQAGALSAQAAAAYDHWYNQSETGGLRTQASPVPDRLWELRAPEIIHKAAFGLDCFDCEFYKQHNKDLPALSCWDVCLHFVNSGQFELRKHRFTCVTHIKDVVVPYLPGADGGAWPRMVTSGCSTLLQPSTLAGELAAEVSSAGLMAYLQ